MDLNIFKHTDTLTIAKAIVAENSNSNYRCVDEGSCVVVYNNANNPVIKISSIWESRDETFTRILLQWGNPQGNLDKLLSLRYLLQVPVTYHTSTKEDMLEICRAWYGQKSLTYLIYKFNYVCSSKDRILRKDMRQINPNNCPYDYEEGSDGIRKIVHIDTFYLSNLHNLIKEFSTIRLVFRSNEAPCEILNYSTRVESILQVNPSESTRFGIELELENATEKNIQLVHKHLKTHAIMKRDGSLSDGVEIVSIPASIEKHKEKYKPFFEEKHTLQAKENCGIHIHVSRGNTSFLALGRILSFMSQNAEHIYKIAGRKSDNYARINKWDLTSPWTAVHETDKYKKLPKFNWQKYTGVNLLPNHTMEFRIFKSTTNFSEFCRFLEFTESILSYCQLAGDDNKGKIRKISDMFIFQNYKDFVEQRGSAYPNLSKFLRESI